MCKRDSLEIIQDCGAAEDVEDDPMTTRECVGATPTNLLPLMDLESGVNSPFNKRARRFAYPHDTRQILTKDQLSMFKIQD